MATRTPNGFLVFIGSLIAVLIVAIIFTASIANGPRPEDLDKKRAELRLAVRAKLDKEAHDLLTTAAWVDKAKGLVRAPVESVLASTATELAAKKPAPSQVKVEPPLPMPVIDPNSSEPPPPALPSAPQGADTVRFPALPLTSVEPVPATAPAPPPVAPPASSPATPAQNPAPPAPKPATTIPAPTAPPPAPAAPAPAPPPPPAAPAPAPAPPAPAPAAPAPAPAAPAPAPAAPAPAPAAPAPAPAAPAPAPAASNPASAPASPNPAAGTPAPPARPPLINPSEQK